MKKASTCVVIPNWNGRYFIGKCLDSLLNQSLKALIIVVDNGSVDGSAEYINDKYPEVECVRLPKNTGFAGGVNRGIDRAMEHGATYVALFNNDAIASRDWLKTLVTAADVKPEVGIITGKFMRSDKKHIDSTGDTLTTRGMPHPRGRNETDNGQYDKPEFVFSATGGASLYRVSLLKEIGLFDEKFFAYFEDVDFSFRAQLAGWKVYYEPKAVSYHAVGGTSSKLGNFARFHTTKNFHLLFLKDMPGVLFWKYFPLAVLQSLRLAAGAVIRGHYWTHLKGYFAAVLLIPHCLEERRRIQSSRKVPVSHIDGLLIHSLPPRPAKLKDEL